MGGHNPERVREDENLFFDLFITWDQNPFVLSRNLETFYVTSLVMTPDLDSVSFGSRFNEDPKNVKGWVNHHVDLRTGEREKEFIVHQVDGEV